MPTDKRKFRPIKYTARDFESIKREINEYRRRYYSNVSRDENEAAFDELVMDTVAYVGDILSFYTDYATNESFLNTSVEFDNVLKHGRGFGHKFKGNPSSYGVGTFYGIFPANATGLGPDANYLFNLKRGSEFASTNGTGYILNEDVNFSDARNEIVVARVDENTGVPTAYAIKANGQILSGRIVEEIIEVGDFEKFLRVELAGEDISEILSVTDDEGHVYYEVDYLSQDVVFRAVSNRDTSTNEEVPNLLRPFVVPRRFVVERERVRTFLQFGFGSENDIKSDPLIDPAEVVLDIFGKDHITDSSFDPTNILGTDKMGIAPSNTNLRVVYRVNTSENVNAAPDSITRVVNPIIQYNDVTILDPEVVRSTNDSLEVTNEESIVGDVSLPTVDELKRRIFGTFGAQNRAVTIQDYKSLVYQMPPKFGAIKRVNVIQDQDSFKRNLNMYILAEAQDGTFTLANSSLKQNLRTWILKSKAINDTIDIIDGRIVNIGIDFTVVGELERNKFEIRDAAIRAVQREFEKKLDIGEPFFITRIYDTLRFVDGVVDVVRVKVFQKSGGNYSDTRFTLNNHISADGRFINVPENVAVEIKFPELDIKGAVK